MITTKTPEEIEILREAGKRIARVLESTAARVAPGVSTEELNRFAEEMIEGMGDTPSFLGYTPEGAPRAYPAGLCVSVNDVVVHGIPNEDPIVLKEGDIVGLDLGLTHKGMIVDSALTVAVGEIDGRAKELMAVTKKALEAGIAAARGGNTVGDIGAAVEAAIRPSGFGIVEDLCGHGVGYAVHEEPFVPNTGEKGTGAKLVPGMVIAIEPMVNEGGSGDVDFSEDGYTVTTTDGSRSAHFEHTLVITEGAPEVVTRRTDG